jgi:anti-sigma regulatory factor (Ser/Thr protein kinase)
MGRKFKRDFRSLNDVFNYIAVFIDKHPLDESTAYALNLAVEELFTNVIKYNTDNPNPILLNLKRSPKAVIAELTDYTTKPFDITKTNAYDPALSLDERPDGGVGIHLVKKLFDKVKYDYTDKQSKITLIKYLGDSDV